MDEVIHTMASRPKAMRGERGHISVSTYRN